MNEWSVELKTLLSSSHHLIPFDDDERFQFALFSELFVCADDMAFALAVIPLNCYKVLRMKPTGVTRHAPHEPRFQINISNA